MQLHPSTKPWFTSLHGAALTDLFAFETRGVEQVVYEF